MVANEEIGMTQIKKFDKNMYEDKPIDSQVNEWIKQNGGHIKVANIQYTITESGYEVVIVTYNELKGLS